MSTKPLRVGIVPMLELSRLILKLNWLGRQIST